jgi:hypothetical protein
MDLAVMWTLWNAWRLVFVRWISSRFRDASRFGFSIYIFDAGNVWLLR